MKTIIHVNQHVIKSNRKTGSCDPVLTVKTYKDNRYAHTAEIKDSEGNVVARVVYRPNNPLSCGAHVWIETELEVDAKKEASEDASKPKGAGMKSGNTA